MKKNGEFAEHRAIMGWCGRNNVSICVWEVNASLTDIEITYNHKAVPRPAVLFSERGQAFDLAGIPVLNVLRTNDNHYDYIPSDRRGIYQSRYRELNFDYLAKAAFILNAMQLSEPLPKGHELILQKITDRSSVRVAGSNNSYVYFFSYFFCFYTCILLMGF